MKELYVVQISLLSVMVNFAEGELALPIRKILWAPTNRAHGDHLHVEGPHVHGTLANCTSKWTEAITTIRGALDGRFGEGDHYQVWDDTLGWTHMGVYNCRNIAGTNTPSQHAFSNAIDIGPYYGVEEQKKFYDFLTKEKEDTNMLPVNANSDKEDIRHVQEMLGVTASGSWDFQDALAGLRSRSGTGDTRDHVNGRMYTQLVEEFIQSKAPSVTNVDSHARSLAKEALKKLAAIKQAI